MPMIFSTISCKHWTERSETYCAVATDGNGFGTMGPNILGVWQSLQPMAVTRYYPRAISAARSECGATSGAAEPDSFGWHAIRKKERTRNIEAVGFICLKIISRKIKAWYRGRLILRNGSTRISTKPNKKGNELSDIRKCILALWRKTLV